MRPVQPVARPITLEQLQLRDPVQLARALHRVDFEPGQHGLPTKQHVGSDVVDVLAVALLHELLRLLEVLHLQLDPGHLAAVAQCQQIAQRRVM